MDSRKHSSRIFLHFNLFVFVRNEILDFQTEKEGKRGVKYQYFWKIPIDLDILLWIHSRKHLNRNFPASSCLILSEIYWICSGKKKRKRHLNINKFEKFQLILISYIMWILENIEFSKFHLILFFWKWILQDFLREKKEKRQLNISVFKKFQLILISYLKCTLKTLEQKFSSFNSLSLVKNRIHWIC